MARQAKRQPPGQQPVKGSRSACMTKWWGERSHEAGRSRRELPWRSMTITGIFGQFNRIVETSAGHCRGTGREGEAPAEPHTLCDIGRAGIRCGGDQRAATVREADAPPCRNVIPGNTFRVKVPCTLAFSGVKVPCTLAFSGGAARAGLRTYIGCTHTMRRRGVVKSCPYRAIYHPGVFPGVFTPGWWSWPYRPESQSELFYRGATSA